MNIFLARLRIFYAQELFYYYNNFKGHIFEQKLKISLKSGHLK